MILGRGAACAALVFGCAAGGEATAPPAYHPTRWDYASFRAAHPELLDPNYLPFMTHRVAGGSEGDLLVFCRWDDAAMPLAVHVAASSQRQKKSRSPSDPPATRCVMKGR